MKNIKTYITLGNCARLNLEIKVKGKFQRVDFSNGGFAASGNARFQTSDENLQKALEESKLYGQLFKLQGQKKIQEASDKTAAKETEPANGNDSEPMTFPNFNALRDYLINDHECKASDVKDLNTALATAKKLGLNVTIE